MHILAPHISCIVLPEELQAAVDQGFNEIFVMTGKEIIKHHKLRGQNRHIRLKVESIPGYTPPQINEVVNFLPAGKVPISLFDRVVAFFKQVMEVKKSDLEAMAWICWNQEQGYHIIIPNQTVSKASASYDWSSLPAGTTIVVDIHSHNTMGAFFSGTDNRDDSNAIGFSGVVGQINNNPPATVWRFNYRDRKIDAKFENLFEVPVREAQEPDSSWIGKVATPSYTGYQGGYQGGYNTQSTWRDKNRGKGKADHLKQYQFQKGQNHHHQTAQGGGQSQFPFPRAAAGSEQRQGPQFHGRGLLPNNPITEEPDSGFGEFWGMGAEGYPGGLIGDEAFDERAEAAARAMASLTEDPDYLPGGKFAKGGDRLGKTVSVVAGDEEANAATQTEGERIMSFENPRYDEIAVNHGTLVAEVFVDIDNNMSFLAGKDNLLKDLMADMTNLMSDEGQAEFFRDMYQSLPSKEKEKIQMNGL
ncbi:hypothetical protein D3C87_459830 [compost metagenome]